MKTNFWARNLLTVACCLFLISFFGCAHDGTEVVEPAGGDAGADEAVTLTLKTVTIDLSVLAQFGIVVDDTTVTTLMSETSPVNNIAGVEFADAEKGQILFVEDAEGNPLAIAYVDAKSIQNGSFTLTIAAIANGLIMANPAMMAVTNAERLTVLGACQNDPLYADLLAAITDALTTEFENTLNADVFPDLYVLSLQMIINAIDEAQAAQASLEAPARITIGDADNAPNVSDVNGDAVRLNNPRFTFYGVSISGQPTQVIKGRSGLLDIGLFPPHAQVTDPVTEDVAIGDGTFTFEFCKVGTSDAGLKGAAANFMKTGVLIIDTLLYCPLSDNAIEKLVEGNALDFLAQAGIDVFKDNVSVSALISAVVDKLLEKDIWVQITKTIYANAPDKEQAIKYLANTKTILKGAKVAFKVLGVYNAANTILPFAKDALTAPVDVELCGTQTNGVLAETCQNIPPTAVIEKTSPEEVYVGDAVVFDASGSKDDVTGSDDLEFAWDFDGDGTLDTGWTADNTATTIFTNVGAYDVVLYVRDIDGLVGMDIYGLAVESRTALGTANHIKAFRNRAAWDTSSFENTMAANGYTEGTGDKQYEILPSTALATEIMIPGQDLVIVMNDQDQAFYNDLAVSLERLERFIENGGVVIWGACDRGWGGGSMATAGITALPGGVVFTEDFDNYNFNNNPASELMAGLPNQLYGTYASHESFSNLAAGSTAHMVDSTGDATLVEYEYERGWVMLTGQPLEYNVAYNSDQMGLVYPRLFNYVLGNVETAANVARGASLLEGPPAFPTSAR